MLAGLPLAPRAATADITYTWHEDDGLNVTGQLDVNSAAQAAGQIQLSDVLSFDFSVPIGTFTLSDLNSGFPLPISTLDAAPTGSPGFTAVNTSGSFAEISFDNGWQTPSGEAVSFRTATGSFQSGHGHWTITGAAVTVPEPSTAAVAVFGAVCGIAYAWARRRRAQRRPMTAQ
jgi:hypothetical protein